MKIQQGIGKVRFMAYSQDLRKRVVVAVENGELTRPAAASLYRVSLSTVDKWLARKRSTGSVEALPHGGGPSRVLAPYTKALRAEVKKHPDKSLEELCEWIGETEGVQANTSMMCRELQRLNLPVKKSRSETRSKKLNG